MNLERLTTPQRVSGVAMLVVVLAAFLPWVSLFGVSALGIEGDGVITLVMGLVGLGVLARTTGLFGAARAAGRASQIVLVVLAAITALIGLFDINGAAAMGLYLTLFGGIAWVIGAVWQLNLAKASGAAAAQPEV